MTTTLSARLRALLLPLALLASGTAHAAGDVAVEVRNESEQVACAEKEKQPRCSTSQKCLLVWRMDLESLSPGTRHDAGGTFSSGL